MTDPATAAQGHPWHVCGASVQGVSHVRTGQGCQDAHERLVLPSGTLVFAVADGAGSASHGDRGAQLAARVVVETLGAALQGEFPIDDAALVAMLKGAVSAGATALENEAVDLQVSLRELATTLIAVVATGDVIAAAQVGDGAVVALSGNDELRAVTRPPAGEYLNQTTFLVSEGATENVQVQVRRGPLRATAAFTDGLQLLALNMATGEPHRAFFTPLFRWLRESGPDEDREEKLRAFLTSPRIGEKTDDDLTLLVASLG